MKAAGLVIAAALSTAAGCADLTPDEVRAAFSASEYRVVDVRALPGEPVQYEISFACPRLDVRKRFRLDPKALRQAQRSGDVGTFVNRNGSLIGAACGLAYAIGEAREAQKTLDEIEKGRPLAF